MSLNPLDLFTASQGFKQVEDELSGIIQGLKDVVEGFPKPFVFLRSARSGLSSNVSNDTMIILGTPVPRGFKGQVEDFNVNFSTAAGTVKIVIVNSSNEIESNVLLDITSNTSGIGKTILDEGQALAIVGQTAGAGVFDTYCSGVIIKS